MKLGHAFEFDVPVDDVGRSAKFFEQLGFSAVAGTGAYPSARRLTDGIIVIALRPDGGQRSGLTYYTDELEATLSSLRGLGVRIAAEADGRRVSFTDPDGHRITLAAGSRADAPRLPGSLQSKLGQFGEISLEVANVSRSSTFWRQLGFEPTQYSQGPGASWDSLSDGLLMVGIYEKGHTKHLFKSPVITYFNEDAAERIQRLKAEGCAFVQEIGPAEAPHEAVMQAPDGQMLFLFGAG